MSGTSDLAVTDALLKAMESFYRAGCRQPDYAVVDGRVIELAHGLLAEQRARDRITTPAGLRGLFPTLKGRT